MAQPRRPIPPLDAAALDRLALRYVERFATTRGKLADYLRRKVRERGWDGAPADPEAVAARMVALGYVDDRAYAEAKAAALTRRGLGGGRVAAALRQARVGEADSEAVRPVVEEGAVDSALAFARRKRIGPFAATPADRPLREKQIGAMIRAGHSFALARTIAGSPPGELPQFDDRMTSTSCDDAEPC
ncbi:RecX family transcriptional regulator [Sphingomonas sp. KR1UV-12]|uniref:RecX family transcriptional regulator n=1 Tax=Sphingomonas aurea TaxID=3063994 RepID=A0ABT9EFI3_9SPHN|nr:RecX family transcriptional regulator [Sphingomonas sp. KR1UV-12]MDP1025612.1 RecX family transcriptional regulator [Sphingomonas sp. KR1UV-12]